MELANELPISKVVQLRAAIAPRGFVLPTHLNLMSSDAGNRQALDLVRLSQRPIAHIRSYTPLCIYIR